MKPFRVITIALLSALAPALRADIDLPTREVNGKTFYVYEVPAKQTIYSITRTYGITREELIRFNPQVEDGLRAGDVLLLPKGETESTESKELTEVAEEPAPKPAPKPEPAPAPEPEPEPEPEPQPEPQPAPAPQPAPQPAPVPAPQPEAAASESLNVAVMLPFMLESENMTRAAENHTEFYRGMLLAVDSLAPKADVSVNLYAYDTEGLASRTLTELRNPEFLTMDYIIAPPDSLSIEEIASVADAGDAAVINLFAVKNDAQLRHESVVQGNIPHDAMYARAIAAFCDQYKDRNVLLLKATDIPSDKAAFAEALRAALVREGIPYETLEFAGKLSAEDLATLPVKDYVFVPEGSSREMLMKILPSLLEYTVNNPTARQSMFGYPEWVILRGDLKDKLHRLHTVIYSRFSTDLDGYNVARVKRSYSAAYGKELPEAVPNTALLGFDTMAWLISAFTQGLTEPFEGVQNTFKIVELPDAGDVNNALYFITFQPSGMVEAKAL